MQSRTHCILKQCSCLTSPDSDLNIVTEYGATKQKHKLNRIILFKVKLNMVLQELAISQRHSRTNFYDTYSLKYLITKLLFTYVIIKPLKGNRTRRPCSDWNFCGLSVTDHSTAWVAQPNPNHTKTIQLRWITPETEIISDHKR